MPNPIHRPLARSTALALFLVLTSTFGTVQAGIIVGPGGNVPMGGTSQWQAGGDWLSGSGPVEWTFSGTSSGTQGVSIQDGEGTVVINHKVGTNTSGQVSLSAAGGVESAYIPVSGNVRAFGWSTSVLNDLVFVRPIGQTTFPSGFISLQWHIDGELKFSLDSPPAQPLTVNSGLAFGHMASADTFISARPAGGDDVLTGGDNTVLRIETLNPSQSLTIGQNDGLEPLRVAGDDRQTILVWANLDLIPDGTNQWAQRRIVNTDESYTELLEMPWGSPVEIMLGLAVYYNVAWSLIDFGQLTTTHNALFDQTAELLAVHLYNADGSPYIGEWELVSANGIDYPEFIRNGSTAVPEPATLTLAALAALAAWSARCWQGPARREATRSARRLLVIGG